MSIANKLAQHEEFIFALADLVGAEAFQAQLAHRAEQRRLQALKIEAEKYQRLRNDYDNHLAAGTQHLAEAVGEHSFVFAANDPHYLAAPVAANEALKLFLGKQVGDEAEINGLKLVVSAIFDPGPAPAEASLNPGPEPPVNELVLPVTQVP